MCVCRCVCLRDYFRISILHLVELYAWSKFLCREREISSPNSQELIQRNNCDHLQVESLRILFSEALLSPTHDSHRTIPQHLYDPNPKLSPNHTLIHVKEVLNHWKLNEP